MHMYMLRNAALLAGVAIAATGCTSLPDPGSAGTVDEGPPPPGFILWRTRRAVLKARGFSIEAGGQEFYAGQPDTHVSGDWVEPSYCTLEAIWLEHGVEMRIFIYLQSDGREWWADEIRTYDGSMQGGWITYRGDFFRSPMGHAFYGDLDLATPANAPIPGRVQFQNLLVQGFLAPTCDGSAYSIEPWAFDVEIAPGPNTGYVLPVTLRDATCAETSMPAGSSYEWSVDDTRIASVVGSGSRGEFTPGDLGATTGRVRMRGADGRILADTAFPVVVEPWP